MEAPPTQDDDPGWRLAGLEVRLDALSERLGRLESTLQAAVAHEVGAAAQDLRHTVSELGRRLAQDLPAELARHRDAIRREIRAAAPPPAAAEPPPSPSPPPSPPPTEVPLPDATASAAGGPATVATGAAEAERAEARRVHRLRRRQG
jgi:hypothetical protein